MDIKSFWDDGVLFSAAVNTIKELVLAAVKGGANLYGANLYGADLCGADLRGANLYGADLCEANLHRANLHRANLYGADLHRANLHGANLYGADLCEANLHRADLCRADLYGADLCEANLHGANLYGADLCGADLRGANLYGADLCEANLCEAKNAYLVQAQTVILPEGNLVGWKKCQDNVIVKLLIPQKARRSNSTGRKCRAEYVKVLRVYGAGVTEGVSIHDGKTIYRVGEKVRCDNWNEDRWVECGGGIHFYITRAEAENS